MGDFGISIVLKNNQHVAKSQCGTPFYFSPGAALHTCIRIRPGGRGGIAFRRMCIATANPSTGGGGGGRFVGGEFCGKMSSLRKVAKFRVSAVECRCWSLGISKGCQIPHPRKLRRRTNPCTKSSPVFVFLLASVWAMPGKRSAEVVAGAVMPPARARITLNPTSEPSVAATVNNSARPKHTRRDYVIPRGRRTDHTTALSHWPPGLRNAVLVPVICGRHGRRAAAMPRPRPGRRASAPAGPARLSVAGHRVLVRRPSWNVIAGGGSGGGLPCTPHPPSDALERPYTAGGGGAPPPRPPPSSPSNV